MMPYMEVDGVKIGQSMACARFLARELSEWAISEYTVECYRHVM